MGTTKTTTKEKREENSKKMNRDKKRRKREEREKEKGEGRVSRRRSERKLKVGARKDGGSWKAEGRVNGESGDGYEVREVRRHLLLQNQSRFSLLHFLLQTISQHLS